MPYQIQVSVNATDITDLLTMMDWAVSTYGVKITNGTADGIELTLWFVVAEDTYTAAKTTFNEVATQFGSKLGQHQLYSTS